MNVNFLLRRIRFCQLLLNKIAITYFYKSKLCEVWKGMQMINSSKYERFYANGKTRRYGR